jgi:hypothetical protein
MKFLSLKKICLSASFLVVVGHIQSASAHEQSGTLGSRKSATDVYLVTCDNEEGGDTPTYRLATRVRDNAPAAAPLVSVSTSKGGSTTKTTDTNGDGNSRFSALAHNNQGNGQYTMKVRKSAAGTEKYAVEFHCEGPKSSGYIHTSTLIQQTQDQ